MMCENATKLASDELDRRLSLGETVGLRLHLFKCGACSGASDSPDPGRSGA